MVANRLTTLETLNALPPKLRRCVIQPSFCFTLGKKDLDDFFGNTAEEGLSKSKNQMITGNTAATVFDSGARDEFAKKLLADRVLEAIRKNLD